jgi:hypothetical protein
MLSEKDLQGKKFFKLAYMLKEGLLTNKKRGNLICLTNIKVVISKMIKVCYMAVAGKLYLVEQSRFNKRYYTLISEYNLKQYGIKDLSKVI